MVELEWQKHLSALGEDLARTKNKGGTYYRARFDAMHLEAEPQSGTTVVESDEGSPPFTEDDRRPRPALHDDQRSGGRGESKLEEEGDDPGLHEISHAEEDRPREERAREKIPTSSGCSAVGPTVEHDNSAEHNAQIAQLISALGCSNAGRKAILTAVAERQGVEDPEVIEGMIQGDSAQKIEVPMGLRDAFRSIGLDHVMTPINLFTIGGGGEIMAASDAWEDLEFDVALDSGSVVHVCALGDCPGYLLQDSPGSKVGQQFSMGDGGQIPNLGQKQLNLSDDALGSDVQSVFQIAAVTRPLMSVGKICDEGHEVTFSNVCAVVRNKAGTELCKFHRDSGGLYVAKLRLRNPLGFVGPE